MVRTERWKYVEFEGSRPQLFDLATDPAEQRDLGADPAHEAARAELHERLFAWLRSRRMRVTLPDAEVERRTDTHKDRGFRFGEW
jgi:arylsulfatase A-like enzyme